MNNMDEVARVRQAVLKAMYDLTNENWKDIEKYMPTRNEMAQRVGIEPDEAAHALEYLTAKRLAKVEEAGDDGSPNYSITQYGKDVVESTPQVVDVSPQDDRQPLVRNMDLIRALLIYIANNAQEHQYIPQPDVAEYSSEVVSYHLTIMREAGLIKGQKMQGGGWGLGPLTWEGQDFLSAAKDDTVWNNVRKNVGPAFGTLALGIVRDLLLKEVRNRLGLT